MRTLHLQRPILAPIVARAPQIIGPPVIVGDPVTGQRLSIGEAPWAYNAAKYTYQWKRDGLEINGATADSYEIALADAGFRLSVVAAAFNEFGVSTVESMPRQPAVRALVPLNISLPVQAGAVAVGQKLSVSNGTWNYSPTSFSYMWLADGMETAGETAPIYIVKPLDIGKTIIAVVTARNATGAGEPQTAITVDGFVLMRLSLDMTNSTMFWFI